MFALLAAVTVAIGAGFAAMGAWMVLPFAGLEAVMLAVAFVLHARGMDVGPGAVSTPRGGSNRRRG